MAIVILLVAVVLEGFSLRTAIHEARPVKPPDQSWWRFIKTTKQPELTVVLLEDSGALTGLVFALAGVLLAHGTGDPRWDAVGSIAIGGLLIVIAVVLMIKMKSLLIGEAADAATRSAIAAAIRAAPDVEALIHMRTEHIGPDEVLLGAKVEFSDGLDQRRLASTIDATEAAIRDAVPQVTVIYLEPDVRRDDSTPAVDHRAR